MTYARRYVQSQSETASPERLMVLLFQAALRHMRSAAAALDARRPAEANGAISRAVDIVLQLHATVDARRAPELADRLSEIYRFVCQRLLEANLGSDGARVREAERAFAPIAEAFGAAVEKVGAEAAR